MAYFPKRYALFSEMLLRELKNEMDSDQLIGYMQKLGKKLANQYRSLFEGRSEEEQINIMVELMEELLNKKVELRSCMAKDIDIDRRVHGKSLNRCYLALLADS